MPEFIIKFEDKIIERVVTEKQRISIGRTPDNDIVLNNRGVSRKHALIEFNNNSALIIDNESLNGTFINNRKISEEVLKENDLITIGKFNIIYHPDAQKEDKLADLDGTMVLKTKKHKDLLEKDAKERELTKKAGSSVLIGEANTTIGEFALSRPVTTLGKAHFVNIRVKGWFLSGIQAKIVKERDGYVLVNLGRQNKTRVNGEPTQKCQLKNDDLIQIGKSVFRFIKGRD
jgi:pSer/pThr/pTyr-binding forkhead associated (FHA) protein